MNLDKYRNLTRDTEFKYINVHPIQRGGVLTPEARKAILEFADGYSVCDFCFEGRVDLVENPPIKEFTGDIAEFLNMDEVRFTAGCRHAKWTVMATMLDKGDAIVVDSLAHYTSYLAAEANGLEVFEVPHSGYPEFRINPENYAKVFEEVKEETGSYPKMALLTHVDYRYGNLTDPVEVGKICEDYEVMFMLNTAYSSGLMEINGKKMRADFIVGSGHKSWAATAPIGFVATNYEYTDSLFSTSKIRGRWSGRGFTKKEVAFFGCSPVFGAPLVTLMASFPKVVERVKSWEKEVENARYFVNEMEKIEGLHQMGIKPTEHTLQNFEALPFHQVAKQHKRRGYFLYTELKRRGVIGVHPGLTKNFKINTFGLTRKQIDHVIWAFKDIAEKYNLEVED